MKNKILTLIQARRGSSRLPDKVMMPLVGKPLLIRMVERVKAAKLAGYVVVATTTDAYDDPIENLCADFDLPCFRGHPTDLLDRHFQAAKQFDLPVVIKIPSDCPLIDPQIIDQVIGFFLKNEDNYDFVSNLHPATYPDGNDVEIMTFQALKKAWKEAKKPLEREHTTPYIWENPNTFRIGNVTWETGLDYSMSHRWTIDYKADYEFIRAVYENLYYDNPLFSLTDILALLERRKDIFDINRKYAGVNWYRHHLNELKTVKEKDTKHAPE